MQLQWALSALSQYGPISGTENILDFGAGDGKISALISNLVPNGSITAVDLSPNMSEFASAFYDQENYPNLSFKTLQDSNFKKWVGKQSFDLALSFSVLHLTQNPGVILDNIARRLTTKGQFVATWPVGQTEESLELVNKVAQAHKFSIPLPSKEQLQMQQIDKIPEIFAKTQLELKTCELVMTKNPFLNKQELIEWFIGTMSANWNIPSAKRQDFFEDLADRHIAANQNRWTSGLVYLEIPRVNIVASRAPLN